MEDLLLLLKTPADEHSSLTDQPSLPVKHLISINDIKFRYTSGSMDGQ